MNHGYNRYSAYKEAAINTASPAKLVVLLYEGAIRFLRLSIEAIEIRDLNGKRQSIDRAVAIVQHLQSTLDFSKGGTIAKELDSLYAYTLTRILDGSSRLDPRELDEAIKVLNTLLSAWEELSGKDAEGVPAGVLSQSAAQQGFTLHG